MRAQLEETDQEEASQAPKNDDWAERPKSIELTSSFWVDPDPDSAAVLSADRIRAYHYLIGRMIRPFQEKHLNPASYDLTLGPRCVIDGKEEILSSRNPVLSIPPGSIALTAPREVLMIPHWLTATFNLKSEYLFKGLLMGIGPQIDPGFMGLLTCPLHNISCESVQLNFNEPYAKIDFVKTTLSQEKNLGEFSSEDELYSCADKGDLLAHDGEDIVLWPRAKNFRTPVRAGRGAAGVKGSLARLEYRMKRFRKLTRWFSAAAAVGAIAIVAGAAGIGAYSLMYTDGRVEDVKSDAARAARSEARRIVQRINKRKKLDMMKNSNFPE
jgi:deoxycytidine triphosphate deaminase